MDKELNIFQRMAAITAELQTVAKNLTVQQTKTSSYKAVSERDILDAVKPLEEKYGVYSYPFDRELLESNLLESESTYNGTTAKKTTFMTRIKTVYRFVNIDKPEEFIDTVTFAEGIDTQDKGSGKAMTYSDKYALMKGYKISTGEDPDQTASGEEHFKKASSKANPSDSEDIKCEACSKLISPMKTADGGIWSASSVAKASYKKYRKVLCTECRENIDKVFESSKAERNV